MVNKHLTMDPAAWIFAKLPPPGRRRGRKSVGMTSCWLDNMNLKSNHRRPLPNFRHPPSPRHNHPPSTIHHPRPARTVPNDPQQLRKSPNHHRHEILLFCESPRHKSAGRTTQSNPSSVYESFVDSPLSDNLTAPQVHDFPPHLYYPPYCYENPFHYPPLGACARKERTRQRSVL
ncbi:hypothetical protein B0H34DRAFT_680506 [Crassisporium funariophilum]|nr:hypothetical protein B0H34DRAFT_680506 [Crassisporium funariophilum]